MKKQKTAQTNWQQGDVIGRLVNNLPEGVKQIAKRSLVLAEGETTGHTHRLVDAGAEMFQLENRMFIKLVNPATLLHEEHKPITIAPGIWEIGRVQEWDYLSKMARRVQD